MYTNDNDLNTLTESVVSYSFYIGFVSKSRSYETILNRCSWNFIWPYFRWFRIKNPEINDIFSGSDVFQRSREWSFKNQFSTMNFQIFLISPRSTVWNRWETSNLSYTIFVAEVDGRVEQFAEKRTTLRTLGRQIDVRVIYKLQFFKIYCRISIQNGYKKEPDRKETWNL